MYQIFSFEQDSMTSNTNFQKDFACDSKAEKQQRSAFTSIMNKTLECKPTAISVNIDIANYKTSVVRSCPYAIPSKESNKTMKTRANIKSVSSKRNLRRL